MDKQYQNLSYHSCEIEHLYGENVHILSNPVMQTILSRFSSTASKLPLLNDQIQFMYQQLINEAINLNFDRKVERIDTRMKTFTEKGLIEGEIIDDNQRAVVISLARAGIFPSHICFEKLHYFLKPENLRQDHFYINRRTNEKNEVIGVDISGSKIGGDVENAIVILPDPMGATGGSISYVVDHYKKQIAGKPKKFIALHLIVTPEYILRMKQDHPDMVIVALRLDRGLSDPQILQTIPGTHPEQERGLTNTQYIVPGAGGVGEILNNSYV